MSPVTVTFLASGDPFGSGGRLETCLLLEAGGDRVLVDCGPTALAGLKKRRIDPAAVHTVLISHLHGDHFAGLPSLILDGQFSKRTTPLMIAGPPGLVEPVRQTPQSGYADCRRDTGQSAGEKKDGETIHVKLARRIKRLPGSEDGFDCSRLTDVGGRAT
jgi:ribonuclease BN (tRNA processing enzyme)